jgi:hypothetical protein
MGTTDLLDGLKVEDSFSVFVHSCCYALNYLDRGYNRGIKKGTPCRVTDEAESSKQIAVRHLLK